jgi:hypothetical protein
MKPAVFTTSEIFNTSDNHLPVVAVLPTGERFFSTGALEEALLLDGLVVHVASTRHAPGSHDLWWIKLVRRSGGQIFWGPVQQDEDAGDPGIGWRELFRFLGEEWPIAPNGAEIHWTSARFVLQDRGYRLGCTFNHRKRNGEMHTLHRTLVDA